MKQKIYLAGGMRSSWSDKVKQLTNVDFFDPKLKPDNHWTEYGTWDMFHIRQCDILFAYMEKSNPSGYGMAAEIGYARGLNKTVIFVLEPGHEKERYFQFLKQFADIIYDDLDIAIDFLRLF